MGGRFRPLRCHAHVLQLIISCGKCAESYCAETVCAVARKHKPLSSRQRTSKEFKKWEKEQNRRWNVVLAWSWFCFASSLVLFWKNKDVKKSARITTTVRTYFVVTLNRNYFSLFWEFKRSKHLQLIFILIENRWYLRCWRKRYSFYWNWNHLHCFWRCRSILFPWKSNPKVYWRSWTRRPSNHKCCSSTVTWCYFSCNVLYICIFNPSATYHITNISRIDAHHRISEYIFYSVLHLFFRSARISEILQQARMQW